MNKKYKLIIINNQTQSNYSISINSFFQYFAYILIGFLIFFFTIGIYRFFKPHAKQHKVNAMLAYKYNTDNLISSLYNQGMIDSTIINKYNLNNSSFDLVPDNLPVAGVVTKGVLLNK